MKHFILTLTFAVITFFSVGSAFAQDVYVNGYTRRDGTYVQPHYRSAPDGNVNNNWSTRGNVNPYTGAVGTRSPEPSNSYGSSFGGYGSSNRGYGSNQNNNSYGSSYGNSLLDD